MRTRLLLAVILVLFAAGSVYAAERIDLGTFGEDLQVQVLESNDQRVVVKFDIGAYYRDEVNIDGDNYYLVRLAGESFLLNAAEPELPRICRSIIIPDDAQMDIEVLSSEFVDIADHPVIPSKGNLLRTVNPEDVPYEFGPVYSQDEWYPGGLASIREPFIIRDYRGTVIDFNAVQYNPVKQTLRVYTSVTVEVKNVGPGQINILENAERNAVEPDFKLLYERRFINFGIESSKYTLVDEVGELLIISHGPFMTAMQPFVDWKMQKGITTTMVDVSTIGNNSTSIKSYIQTMYDDPNHDLAYILLVGDAAQVATPYSSGGSSDPSYVKLAGGDNYPDAFIGRFSAETIDQVNTQVDRTITYEQSPLTGDWFHKGFGVASSQGAGSGHYGEADYVHIGYIRDDLLGFTYTLVDEIYDPTATDAMVTNALNNGRSIANYCGHGSTTSWSTTGFNNADINALTNDNMLPYIVSVACVNGQFDGYTCFGEAWMRATNNSNGAPTGAIGIYCSSINQSWAPPMYAQDEAVDLLVAQTMVTSGGISFNGSAYMLEQVNAVDMYDTWHIFGDPSVLLRTDTPEALTVNYPAAVFFNVPTVQVEVVGVENALCALYYDGVIYGTGYTDATGFADIALTQSLPIGQSVTLTVTAFNKEVFTGSIQAASDLAIVHDPLPNSKDTLNDYEVNCTIYSSNTIIGNTVKLHYDVGAGWVEQLMSQLKVIEEDYQAYIPVQLAGTSISYYMTAENTDGFYDTTDVFTFEVIDYQILVTPDELSTTAPVDDTVVYDIRVTNDGVLADEYSLAVTGNTWETTIWDATGTSQVTSTGTLLGDEYFDIKIKVVIPASLEGEIDECTFTATSLADASVYGSTAISTVSAGMPWPIPFTEVFATTSFDMTKWESVGDATINQTGIDEPSPPYSCNLNGQSTGGDVIETEKINLKDESNIIVKYYYQQTGDGESPDAGDDLIIEYLDNTGSYQELNRHLGADPDMTEFEEVELTLPADAMHAEFRLKIYCTATSGAYDDWFFDDLYVGHPSDYDVRITPGMQSQYGPAGDSCTYTLTILNKGFLDDSFTMTSTGGWDVAFFDASFNQTSTIGPVAGGDSVDVIVKVVVPDGTPLHELNMSTVYATSVGDPNMSAYAMVETISAGTPALIPWYETFPEDTLMTQHWFEFIGVTVSTLASNPPSMPYSFCLDGGNDTASTQLIDLSGQSGVLLSYFYEKGGGMNMPDAGENLYIDYRNSTGGWTNLQMHAGGGESMTEFEYVSVELPADAHHNSLQIRLRSNGSAANEDYWFVDNIRIDYPPAMACSHSSMSQTLLQGDSAMVEMIIENSGQGGLVYEVDLVPHVLGDRFFTKATGDNGYEEASHIYPEEVYADVAKGTDIQFQGFTNRYDRGGPDNFGYYWQDSDAAGGPAYEWIDISGGTDIIASMDDDNYAGPFDLGFEFTFYGRPYSQVYIGSNGIVGFEEASMDARTPRPIPTSYAPNTILALIWDDLDPTDADNPGAHLYYEAMDDKFVISFVDYPEYRADAGDIFSGQVIIYADGRIKYQYQSFAANFSSSTCAVGIENHYGNDGLEVAYYAPYLKDGLAIEFWKPYEWLFVDTFEGIIDPGASDTINVKFRTSMDLEPGNYTADIMIHNNDPQNDPMTVLADLTVNENIPYICGDANGTGNVDVSDAVYIVNYVFVSGSPTPDPIEAADANCNGEVDVSDAVYIVNFIFVDGPAPCSNCP